MSGRWRIAPAEIEKHDHFILETDEGTVLALNDARRFGSLDIAPILGVVSDRIGPRNLLFASFAAQLVGLVRRFLAALVALYQVLRGLGRGCGLVALDVGLARDLFDYAPARLALRRVPLDLVSTLQILGHPRLLHAGVSPAARQAPDRPRPAALAAPSCGAGTAARLHPAGSGDARRRKPPIDRCRRKAPRKPDRDHCRLHARSRPDGGSGDAHRRRPHLHDGARPGRAARRPCGCADAKRRCHPRNDWSRDRSDRRR